MKSFVFLIELGKAGALPGVKRFQGRCSATRDDAGANFCVEVGVDRVHVMRCATSVVTSESDKREGLAPSADLASSRNRKSCRCTSRGAVRTECRQVRRESKVAASGGRLSERAIQEATIGGPGRRVLTWRRTRVQGRQHLHAICAIAAAISDAPPAPRCPPRRCRA
jgi:hypothetical protein